MKKEYKLGEDLFLGVGVLFIGVAIILKLFHFSFNLGFTSVGARNLFELGISSLLLSIAINVQDLSHKKN